MGCEKIFASMDKINPRGPLLIQARKIGWSRGKFSVDLVSQAWRKEQIFSHVPVFEGITKIMSDLNDGLEGLELKYPFHTG